VTITLSASDLATVGAFAVVVANPAPGGGNSNAANFTVGGSASQDQGSTSSLLFVSGALAGQALSSSNVTITVAPGATISGDFNVQINSTYPSSAVMAMGVTPTWGAPQSSFTDLGGFATPASGLQATVPINLTAPSTPGTYYIIAAFRGEFAAAQLMSCTNWSVGSVEWNTGYPIADWSASTIETADANGTVLVNYAYPQGDNPVYVPATAITVVVAESGNAVGCPPATATAAIQWTTAWCDEFTGATPGPPDTTKWNFDLGNGAPYGLPVGWGNNELEIYCGPPGYQDPSSGDVPNPAGCPSSFSTITSNAYIDGNGHLAVSIHQPQANSWTSARLKTKGLQNFLYGRFEASIEMPSQPGLWPAFWMLGNNGVWPASGESDIMENWPGPSVSSCPALGDGAVRSTVHTALTGGAGTGEDYEFSSGQQVNTAFHSYGEIWSAYMIQFYVDDPTKPFFVVTAGDLQTGDA
jgi:beta-glucanase (GH16 family)